MSLDLLVESALALFGTAVGIVGLWLHPMQESNSGKQKLSKAGWATVLLLSGSCIASIVLGYGKQKQDKAIQSKLDGSERQLREVHDQLESAQSKLDSSEQQLKEVNVQLASAQSKLDGSDRQLKEVHFQLERAQSKLDGSEKQLQGVNSQLQNTQRQLESAQHRLDGTDRKLEVTNGKLDELIVRHKELGDFLQAKGKMEVKDESELAKRYSHKARGERVFDMGRIREDYEALSREIERRKAEGLD